MSHGQPSSHLRGNSRFFICGEEGQWFRVRPECAERARKKKDRQRNSKRFDTESEKIIKIVDPLGSREQPMSEEPEARASGDQPKKKLRYFANQVPMESDPNPLYDSGSLRSIAGIYSAARLCEVPDINFHITASNIEYLHGWGDKNLSPKPVLVPGNFTLLISTVYQIRSNLILYQEPLP